jgi:hypothetical protein
VPYVVAIVELDEGPQLTTLIINCPVDAVSIGMRVRPIFVRVTEDIGLIDFEPDQVKQDDRVVVTNALAGG